MKTCENKGLIGKGLNPLLDDKLLALSKLYAFADNSSINPNNKFVYHTVDEIAAKGQKHCLQTFYPFIAMFSGTKSCHSVVKG